MKKLFFLYVWLNLMRIAELRKEDLVKHIRKRTIQTGRLFFSSSLKYLNTLSSRLRKVSITKRRTQKVCCPDLSTPSRKFLYIFGRLFWNESTQK